MIRKRITENRDKQLNIIDEKARYTANKDFVLERFKEITKLQSPSNFPRMTAEQLENMMTEHGYTRANIKSELDKIGAFENKIEELNAVIIKTKSEIDKDIGEYEKISTAHAKQIVKVDNRSTKKANRAHTA